MQTLEQQQQQQQQLLIDSVKGEAAAAQQQAAAAQQAASAEHQQNVALQLEFKSVQEQLSSMSCSLGVARSEAQGAKQQLTKDTLQVAALQRELSEVCSRSSDLQSRFRDAADKLGEARKELVQAAVDKRSREADLVAQVDDLHVKAVASSHSGDGDELVRDQNLLLVADTYNVHLSQQVVDLKALLGNHGRARVRKSRMPASTHNRRSDASDLPPPEEYNIYDDDEDNHWEE